MTARYEKGRPITTVYLKGGWMKTMTCRSAVRGISTTKMASADAERLVYSAIETVFNELDGIFSLKEDQTTTLKA